MILQYGKTPNTISNFPFEQFLHPAIVSKISALITDDLVGLVLTFSLHQESLQSHSRSSIFTTGAHSQLQTLLPKCAFRPYHTAQYHPGGGRC